MATTKIEIPGWSANPVEVTEECAPGGSGQCDGHDYDGDTSYGQDCECPCHRLDLRGLNTTQVEKWHQMLHRLDGTESSLPLDDFLTVEYVLLHMSLNDSVNSGLMTDSQADVIEQKFIAALENQED